MEPEDVPPLLLAMRQAEAAAMLAVRVRELEGSITDVIIAIQDLELVQRDARLNHCVDPEQSKAFVTELAELRELLTAKLAEWQLTPDARGEAWLRRQLESLRDPPESV